MAKGKQGKPKSTASPKPTEAKSLDELLDDVLREQSKSISTEEIRAKPSYSRPVVARLITLSLIWLFVGQVGLFALAYVVFTWLSYKDSALLSSVPQTVLQGMEKILPFTTTLLGVVIGYYFRERGDDTDERQSSKG